MTTRYLNGHAMDQRFARYDIAGKAVAFYLTDNVNSVRMIVSPTGAVQWTGHYTAFGTLASSTGPGGDRFTFTGRELDATGQYYYRARYYGAGIGRFTSEDPISFTAGDTNLYRYVGNGSLTATDPSGLTEWSWGNAAVGGAWGGVVGGVGIIVLGPGAWIGAGIVAVGVIGGGYFGGYAASPREAALRGAGVGLCACVVGKGALTSLPLDIGVGLPTEIMLLSAANLMRDYNRLIQEIRRACDPTTREILKTQADMLARELTRRGVALPNTHPLP